MRCWFFHDWSRWSDPYQQEMFWMDYETHRKTKYYATRQARKCDKCNETQVRKVKGTAK